MVKVSITSRRIPKEIQAPLRAYAVVIGEVVWAWNFTHGAFEILFSHVASHANYQMARDIWHTATSDSGQLTMLEAATKASDRLSSRMRERILWAIEKTSKLGQLRNDAVHSAMIVIDKNGVPTVSPSDIGTKPSRSERLRREDDLKKKFRAVKGDILQVGLYIHSLWPHVAGFDLLPPLPRRPRLRSLSSQQQLRAKRTAKK